MAKCRPRQKTWKKPCWAPSCWKKSAFDVVAEILKPECFYVDAHQRVFKVMQGLQQKNQPIDILTVVEELKSKEELETVGGPYFVTRLTNAVVSSANIEAHARIILQKFIQRELIRISGEIINDSYEDSTDVFDLLDDAESKLFEITNNHLRKNFDKIDDILVKTVARIEDMRHKNEDITGVPTGFPRLTGLLMAGRVQTLLSWQPAHQWVKLLLRLTLPVMPLYTPQNLPVLRSSALK